MQAKSTPVGQGTAADALRTTSVTSGPGAADSGMHIATVRGDDRLLELTRGRAVMGRALARGAIGVQVVVLTGDRHSAILSAGLANPGQTLDALTPVPWLCAGKPLLSVLCLQLAAGRDLSLDTLVTHVVPGSAARHRDVTVRHLLANNAGLDEPLAGPELAELRWRVAPGYRPGRDWRYSPVLNWLLLEEVITRMLGADVEALLRERMLAPLGLDCDFLPTAAGGAGAPARSGRGAGNFLSYHVPTASGNAWLPARFFTIGGRDAASRLVGPLGSLVVWYAALLRCLREDGGVLSPSLLDSALAPTPGSPDYGTGIMVNMRKHLAGRHCSQRSFGHLAGLGDANLIAAYAEPAGGDTAVAVLVNSVSPRSVYDISAIGTAVYEDLGLRRSRSPAHG